MTVPKSKTNALFVWNQTAFFHVKMESKRIESVPDGEIAEDQIDTCAILKIIWRCFETNQQYYDIYEGASSSSSTLSEMVHFEKSWFFRILFFSFGRIFVSEQGKQSNLINNLNIGKSYIDSIAFTLYIDSYNGNFQTRCKHVTCTHELSTKYTDHVFHASKSFSNEIDICKGNQTPSSPTHTPFIYLLLLLLEQITWLLTICCGPK